MTVRELLYVLPHFESVLANIRSEQCPHFAHGGRCRLRLTAAIQIGCLAGSYRWLRVSNWWSYAGKLLADTAARKSIPTVASRVSAPCRWSHCARWHRGHYSALGT